VYLSGLGASRGCHLISTRRLTRRRGGTNRLPKAACHALRGRASGANISQTIAAIIIRNQDLSAFNPSLTPHRDLAPSSQRHLHAGPNYSPTSQSHFLHQPTSLNSVQLYGNRGCCCIILESLQCKGRCVLIWTGASRRRPFNYATIFVAMRRSTCQPPKTHCPIDSKMIQMHTYLDREPSTTLQLRRLPFGERSTRSRGRCPI